MESVSIIALLSGTLPALVIGVVAYYFLSLNAKNEEGRRSYLLNKDAHKEVLPIRLQAYERMTLFLERINLTKLLIRIAPLTNDKKDYEELLITQIEQEFEHNLTQQIYISDDCWTIIQTAKNATIQMIRKATINEEITSTDKLREVLLNDLMDKQSPSNAALSYIKNEVNLLW